MRIGFFLKPVLDPYQKLFWVLDDFFTLHYTFADQIACQITQNEQQYSNRKLYGSCPLKTEKSAGWTVRLGSCTKD